MKKIILSVFVLLSGLLASCSSNTEDLNYALDQFGDAKKNVEIEGIAQSKELSSFAKKLYPGVSFPRDFKVTGYLTQVDSAEYWYFVYTYQDSAIMAKKFPKKDFKMSMMFSSDVWDSTKTAVMQINPDIVFGKKK